MTSDPRSITVTKQSWMTDSRVYGLLWLGRWMERADNMLRAIDAMALYALRENGDTETFRKGIESVATSLGAVAGGSNNLLHTFLQGPAAPSVFYSIERARDNANEVAPLELIQALNRLLDDLSKLDLASAGPSEVHHQVSELLAGMSEAFGAVEKQWFRKEPLSEEEIFRRFVQQ